MSDAPVDAPQVETASEPPHPEPEDLVTMVDTRVTSDGAYVTLLMRNGRGEAVTAHFDAEGAGQLGGVLIANALQAKHIAEGR